MLFLYSRTQGCPMVKVKEKHRAFASGSLVIVTCLLLVPHQLSCHPFYFFCFFPTLFSNFYNLFILALPQFCPSGLSFCNYSANENVVGSLVVSSSLLTTRHILPSTPFTHTIKKKKFLCRELLCVIMKSVDFR